jgi:hypothetical protein
MVNGWSWKKTKNDVKVGSRHKEKDTRANIIADVAWVLPEQHVYRVG